MTPFEDEVDHMTRPLSFLQVSLIAALLLTLMLGVQDRVLLTILVVSLIGTWMLAAVTAPISLLVSSLALATTAGVLGQLQVESLPFSANGLLVAALGFASMLSIALHYRDQFQSREEIRGWLLDGAPFFVLPIIALVRTPFTPNLVNAVSDLFIWTSVGAVYVLARACWTASPNLIKRGTSAFVWLALLPVTALLMDALLGNVFFNNSSTQISLGLHTTLGVRMIPSLFTLLMIPMAIGLRRSHNQATWQRWFLVILVVVLALWVYISLSRLMFVVMAGLVLPLCILQPRSPIKAMLIVGIGVAAAAAFVLSPFYLRVDTVDVGAIISVQPTNDLPGSGDEVAINVDPASLNALTLGRSVGWRYLLEEGLKSPVLGHGTGASREAVQVALPYFDNPHNDYLRIFFDQGLVGLVIFVLSWLWKLAAYWRRWVRLDEGSTTAALNLGAFIGVAFVLMGMLTDNFLVYFFIMGPLAILLGLADASTAQEPQKSTALVH